MARPANQARAATAGTRCHSWLLLLVSWFLHLAVIAKGSEESVFDAGPICKQIEPINISAKYRIHCIAS